MCPNTSRAARRHSPTDRRLRSRPAISSPRSYRPLASPAAPQTMDKNRVDRPRSWAVDHLVEYLEVPRRRDAQGVPNRPILAAAPGPPPALEAQDLLAERADRGCVGSRGRTAGLDAGLVLRRRWETGRVHAPRLPSRADNPRLSLPWAVRPDRTADRASNGTAVHRPVTADVAQLVAHPTCNRAVRGSSPLVGSVCRYGAAPGRPPRSCPVSGVQGFGVDLQAHFILLPGRLPEQPEHEGHRREDCCPPE